jgi:DNA helicase II / ATP-dependent DNA helicase PcrA
MIDYKRELNEEQYSVVTGGDGHCLVLAGAGSGKTRAITYRVAYLLEHGVKPEEVLLVTFTNKAAREMKERVENLTGGEARLPWSGTFHHIGYRILRKYAPLLGYTNNFNILDGGDSIDLVKMCLKQEKVGHTSRKFPSAKVIRSIISFAKNVGESVESVIAREHPQWIDFSDSIVRIAGEYHRRKVEGNTMDFDDLLVNTYLLLLQSEQVRARYAEQFRYVLVDEYQDTNRVQADIISLFSSHHANLLVVGDDAQSIYSFRAADIRNILDFESDHPGTKIFRLETNYRSTPEILRLASEVIAGNTHQYEKNLKSVNDAFTKPEVHAFADADEEAEFVADRIEELREEGVLLSDIAVLFRAAYQSQTLEVELTKRDIPYDYRGGVRFFERAHVKDVLAYLRIFANRHDIVAWNRVLTMQTGIGSAGVARVVAGVRSLPVSDGNSPLNVDELDAVGEVLGAKARVGFNDFASIYGAICRVSDVTPAKLILAVINSKYRDQLEVEYPDYRERLGDLDQLAVFAEKVDDLSQFLGEITLQESYTKAGGEDSRDKLVLSTVHQAKGLEWEAVFIISMASGKFPNDKSLDNLTALEEERRLFYVAVTRAKRHLHVSYSVTGGFTGSFGGPSMFLEEINPDIVHSHSLAGGNVWNDPSDDVDDVSYEPDDDIRPRKGFFSSIDNL